MVAGSIEMTKRDPDALTRYSVPHSLTIVIAKTNPSAIMSRSESERSSRSPKYSAAKTGYEAASKTYLW
jgi:hypothetical protein